MMRERFLSNGQKKGQPISFLCNMLSARGVDVLVADDDADTFMVRNAVEMVAQEPVQTVAEDTEMLCMQVHHISAVASDVLSKTKSASFSTRTISQNLPEDQKKVLLHHEQYLCIRSSDRLLKRLQVAKHQQMQ